MSHVPFYYIPIDIYNASFIAQAIFRVVDFFIFFPHSQVSKTARRSHGNPSGGSDRGLVHFETFQVHAAQPEGDSGCFFWRLHQGL